MEAKAYGDKVVANLCGPAPIKLLGQKQYYTLFKDLYSCEEHITFLHLKSKAFQSYKEYEAWVKVQCGVVIKIFSCNQGGEFTSKEFDAHLKNAGTICHLMVHDSPSSNGTAERANQMHLKCAQAIMMMAGLPKNLWAEAVQHSM